VRLHTLWRLGPDDIVGRFGTIGHEVSLLDRTNQR
jgi:hypothetical protein